MTTPFKIIKPAGPVPTVRGRGRPNVYPFHQMEVGEAFDVPIIIRGKVATAARKYGERRDRTFTTRKISDRTVRVWRVA